MRSGSPPGSTTTACLVSPHANTVQLHWKAPTGKVSTSSISSPLPCLLSRGGGRGQIDHGGDLDCGAADVAGQAAERSRDEVHRGGAAGQRDQGRRETACNHRKC